MSLSCLLAVEGCCPGVLAGICDLALDLQISQSLPVVSDTVESLEGGVSLISFDREWCLDLKRTCRVDNKKATRRRDS